MNEQITVRRRCPARRQSSTCGWTLRDVLNLHLFSDKLRRRRPEWIKGRAELTGGA